MAKREEDALVSIILVRVGGVTATGGCGWDPVRPVQIAGWIRTGGYGADGALESLRIDTVAAGGAL